VATEGVAGGPVAAWRARLARLTGVSGCPREDVLLAAAVAGFALLLWSEAQKVPPPFFDPLGSAAVPKSIALILAVLAVVILARALVALPWPPREAPDGYRPRPDIAVGIVLLAIAYIAVMHLRLVGFELATIGFLIGAAALLGRLERKTLALGVVSAFLIGIGATWLFTRFFFIDLPR
jgi:putative tricarboxylic transport membrane protein